MRLMITGAKGQLGADLVKVLFNHDTKFTDKDQLDITDFKETLKQVGDFKPDAVINAAAYTNVDGCEIDPEAAYRVNAVGSQNLAVACYGVDAALLCVSTDFVFDGKKGSPYLEYDEPNPLSIYGRSKLAGERYVSSLLNKFYIVRTAWLYGHQGQNFVKSIIKLAGEKDELRIVNDQIGCPTYSLDLAQKIAEIVESEGYGIYHAVNEGSCSWYDFGKAILRQAGIDKKIISISSDELRRPAARPAYSVLDNFSLRTRGFTPFRSWEEGLEAYFEKD